jgi:hypothetical protein
VQGIAYHSRGSPRRRVIERHANLLKVETERLLSPSGKRVESAFASRGNFAMHLTMNTPVRPLVAALALASLGSAPLQAAKTRLADALPASANSAAKGKPAAKTLVLYAAQDECPGKGKKLGHEKGKGKGHEIGKGKGHCENDSPG